MVSEQILAVTLLWRTRNLEMVCTIRALGYQDANCGWISFISENKKDRHWSQNLLIDGQRILSRRN